MADAYIPRLSTGMKIAVQKTFRRQICTEIMALLKQEFFVSPPSHLPLYLKIVTVTHYPSVVQLLHVPTVQEGMYKWWTRNCALQVA